MHDLPYDATRSTDADHDAPPPTEPPVGANGFLLAPSPDAGPVRPRGSRWEGDSVTYHRWGRVVASALLVLPALWMLFFMSIGGVLFLALYVFIVLPVAMRQVWRRTTPTVLPLRSSPPRGH